MKKIIILGIVIILMSNIGYAKFPIKNYQCNRLIKLNTYSLLNDADELNYLMENYIYNVFIIEGYSSHNLNESVTLWSYYDGEFLNITRYSAKIENSDFWIRNIENGSIKLTCVYNKGSLWALPSGEYDSQEEINIFYLKYIQPLFFAYSYDFPKDYAYFNDQILKYDKSYNFGKITYHEKTIMGIHWY